MMTKYGQRKGFLVAIGGAEDRSRDGTILKQLTRLNRAEHVVIIPTATSYPEEAVRTYRNVFYELGVCAVDAVDIRYRDEAESSRYVEPVKKADLVFFTGGDQVRLVDVLDESRVLRAIRDQYAEGMTIAGTSAGAAAIGNPMIYNGDDEGFNKAAVEWSRGFGFLPDVIIDTHFIERERIPRVCQALASGRARKSIGLSEDTAILIAPDNTFEVVGRGVVAMFNSDNLSYTNYHERETRESFTVDGVNIGFLAPGTTFDMETWRVLKEGRRQDMERPPSSGDVRSEKPLSNPQGRRTVNV